MQQLSVQEFEAAINFWRDRRPARGNEYALSPEVNALARVYALMIMRHDHVLDLDAQEERVRQLLQQWRQQAPRQ